MKMQFKIFLLTLFCFQQLSVSAQSYSRDFGAYYNLEKYWFYRYRLINDFMKIGPNCGESLPFQERRKTRYGDPKTGAGVEDMYDFNAGGEIPINLGNYIATLATEYNLLVNNGLNTTRTLYELELALNAFERIDKKAEAYTHDFFFNNKYDSLCNPQNEQGDRLNGYFIRDDVPYLSFIKDNFAHFNRNGSLTKLQDWRTTSSALDRWENIKPGVIYSGSTTDPKDWYRSGWKNVCVPHEESQDGIINLAMGFALTSKLLGGFGTPLGYKAGGNLQRMIEYINDGSKIGLIRPWKIINPISGKCVFGDRWENKPCHGGGEFFYIAYGGADVSQKWGFFRPGLVWDAKNFALLWHLQQYNTIHEDLNFWGTFAALGRNWTTMPSMATIPIGRNTTWSKMKKFANKFHEGMPHLPYLYRVMYKGRGASFMQEQTKIKLDMAPPCGTHNYYGDYSNRISWETGAFVHNNGPKGEYSWHWSGSNLIASYYSRDGWKRAPTGIVPPWSDGDISGGPYGQHTDFNGLDYMTLFNLFSLQDFYLLWMFNSYYRENFNMDFPNSSGLGTDSKRLKLNFLEYVSAINKVNPDGCFTMRCAKAIDLKPGFEAKTGSKFLAYVEDYEIKCGEYKPEEGKFIPSDEYHYAEVNEKPSIMPPGSMQAPPQTDTTYFLNYPPDGVPYAADSAAYTTLGEDEDTLTCEEKWAIFDSTVAQIYASGDPDQIAYIDSLIPYITFPECDSSAAPPSYMGGNGSGGSGANGNKQQNAAGSAYANRLMAKLLDKQKDGTDFNIFPNPSNGHFTFVFADVAEYDIKIYNSLGVLIFQTHVYNRRSEIVHLDGLANGIYTAEVVNSKGAPNKKIRKIIIAQ